METQVDAAVAWLDCYLILRAGAEDSLSIKQAAATAGISTRTLQRARVRLGAVVVRNGTVPSTTYWRLPR
jgi:hypothetical protein